MVKSKIRAFDSNPGGGPLRTPVRSYLVSQVVDILSGEIAKGRFREELPGEHPLCQSLNVSRTTLRAALDILQKRGYLRARPGRPRLVLNGRKPAKKAAQRGVFFLSGLHPIHTLTRRGLVIRMMVMNHLQRMGFTCRYLADKRFVSDSPDAALQRVVSGNSDHLWILASCSAATQSWFFSRGYPAFVHGNLHSGVRLPGFDVDYQGVGRHAASYLWMRGHRDFCLAFREPLAAGDLRVRLGFMEALEKLGSSRSRVSTLKISRERKEMSACVDKLLGLSPMPTALFVINEEIAISIYSCLRSKGVRIPEDLSLIVGTGGPMADFFFPDLTRYQTDFSSEIGRVCRLVADFATHGTLSPTWHYLTPELHAGDTVAPRRPG